MRTVNEVSKITGVSVRTLHYYDAINLLKPAKVTEAGYRLYDDEALCRLQSILLFRELQFPLKEIKKILDSPDFDWFEALDQQINLLELQYKRLGKLISFAREIQEKGAVKMGFSVFDRSEIDRYEAEAKARWGGTEEYREYEKKEKRGQDFADGAEKLMECFAELGTLRGLPPSDQEVQEKLRNLQMCITDHYYPCSNGILAELSQMYVEDERFRKKIDQAGGEGTAEFVRQAAEVYCSECRRE